MLESELIKKQEELDLKKYDQSFLARCDLSGKMPYCKGCLMKTDLPTCAIDHATRQRFTVCARNFFRLEEEKNAVREQDKRDTNSRQTKRNKKKSSVL